ncbi:hypothetical protein SynBIOSU31_02985 [Synechococcus sp. BIOS-U3-1]|uniref:hypothetical protein n=1 Tax=Synechococcus sp. BIOS-U3-1 TaxID=1400865 RepID=UPI001644887E|nr:hypothetical protein [Synechococcus sp. BIOS-U3-1]QNI59839.1 hypothetical protein SynBIOSU31_02985 [Synechococcus sp. BIOS-U3-1]
MLDLVFGCICSNEAANDDNRQAAQATNYSHCSDHSSYVITCVPWTSALNHQVNSTTSVLAGADP